MKNNRYINWLMAATMMIAAFATAACEDEPDKYEVAGGLPVVKYVRTPLAAEADSYRCLYVQYGSAGGRKPA